MQSKVINSEIGTYHWLITIAAEQKRIGEAIQNGGQDVELLKKWGERLCELSLELINHGQVNEKQTWFLLYDGNSPDGRGDSKYVGRTTDKIIAQAHYTKVYECPYSTGKVMIVTDTSEERASEWTDWDKL